MRGFRHWWWHLDEMYVKINGEQVYLWRAVDLSGNDMNIKEARRRLGMQELITFDEDDVMEAFFENGWTDGLPIVPPTLSRVAAMLDHVGRDAGEVLGLAVGRGRMVTVEIAAINSVMAGCRPEYFPIVLTALEATLDGAFRVNTVTSSTGGAAICVVVSGPLAGQIDMNAGSNVLGSGNRANATIGRAVRLTLTNALGAKPGMMDATSIGHPGKFTLCFAEKEPVSPWDSLRVEQRYSAGDTVVTVMGTDGPRTIGNMLSEDGIEVLRTIAAGIRAPSNYIAGKGGQVIVVLGYEHALACVNSGLSRADVKAFLVEQCRLTASELEAVGIPATRHMDMMVDADGRYRTIENAEDILLVTAGGPGAGWSAVIPSWTPKKHSRYVTKRVRRAGERAPDCGPDACTIDLAALMRANAMAGSVGTEAI